MRFLLAALLLLAQTVFPPAPTVVRTTAREFPVGSVLSAVPPGSTLLNDLVAYYPLDEQSGTRPDAIGSADLTDNNTVLASNAGPSGTVAKFVKADTEYLQAANAQTFLSDTSWSIGWWMQFDATKLTTNSPNHDIISADVGGGTDLSLILRYGYQVDGHMPFNLYIGDGTTFDSPFSGYLAAGSSADANWHYYLLVRDGTNVKMYRDGSYTNWLYNGSLVLIDASGTTSKVSSEAEPVRLGTSAAGLASDGSLSRVGIWSTTLSEAERTSLFNSGAGKAYADLTTAEKVGLVSYWNLDETSDGSGAVTRVDSHGSNDLTDNNTTASATAVAGAMHNAAASFVAANNEHLSSAGGIINTIVPDTSLSLSFWLNLADADFAVQFRQGSTGGTTEGFSIYYEAPNLAFSTTDGTHENRVNYAYSGNIGGFHHILYQWDKAGSTNGTVTVYVDNVVNPAGAADLSYMPSITDTALHIGAWQSGAIGTDGLIDEVAIWSRVLTADERAELYNLGSGKFYAEQFQ